MYCFISKEIVFEQYTVVDLHTDEVKFGTSSTEQFA